MCGIAGIVAPASKHEQARRELEQMTDRLAHRGPDGRGIYWDENSDMVVGLGHRRLSIIDLGGGHQPLCNETSDVWITFNGEIYNYIELRRNLEAKGHRFRTHSDTETIVHLYEEYGHECVKHLRGMFAFAIWDKRKQELFFARDRFGEKPFVYTHNSHGFAFASELKALSCYSGLSREIDQEALEYYLSIGFIPHPWTIFKAARKLPPAHYGVLNRGQLTIKPYWSLNTEPDYSLSGPNLFERVNELVHDSVRIQLRSDVPLGAFLSGGLDSTAVVAAVQDAVSTPVNTYTIGFDDARFDETLIARSTAQKLGTNHHELQLHDRCEASLEELAGVLDEPFADSSALSTLQVSKLARNHLKVVLTGDGGDELFGGYDRYHTIDKLQRFSRLPGVYPGIASLKVWDRFPPRGGGILRKIAFRARIMRSPFPARYIHWHQVFSPEERQLLRPTSSVAQSGLSSAHFTNLIHQCRSPYDGTKAMYADLQTYLPDDLLYKVDITSMAHGLECRAPYLDHKLVEFVSSIPFPYHRRRSNAKPVLSSAFSDRIPSAVKKSPKRGFGIPASEWLKRGLRARATEVFSQSNRLTEKLGLDRNYISQLWQEHSTHTIDRTQQLWSLLMLDIWLTNVGR